MQILNGVKTGYRKTAKSFADRYATVLLQLDPQGMEALLAKEKREQEAKIERIKNNKPNMVLSLLSVVFMSISLILTIIAFVILNKAFHNEDDDVFYLWQTPRVFVCPRDICKGEKEGVF